MPKQFDIVITEDTIPPSHLLQVVVENQPTNSLRRPYYRILGGACLRYFFLDQAGRVYLQQALDFDRGLTCRGFDVSVSHPDYQLTTHVNVTVLAVNDNRPRIRTRSPADSDIEENTPPGKWRFELEVEDVDVYEGGRRDNITISVLRYRSSSSEVPFAVLYDPKAPYKPLIVNTHSLDYEEGPRTYSLQIAAFDGNRRSNYFYLFISVLNVNDLPPKFTQDQYHFVADEEIGDVFVAVVAKDEDSSFLSYRIELINNVRVPFSINSFGQIRNTIPLDAESLPSNFTFLAIAEDSGGLSASSQVTISIRDINEFRPVFRNTTRAINLLETTPTGTVIGHVMATDKDIGPIYGKVSYELISTTNEDIPFEIGLETGIMILSEPLDYETVVTYDVLVVARDGGGLGVTGRLFITVEDVNDVPPCPCEAESTYDIEENKVVYVDVWKIEVCGGFYLRDTNFTLQDSYDDSFSVDRFGRVFISKPLDHETSRQYTLNITLSGLFLECSYPASLTVNVLNVDEFLPVFEEEEYVFSILEDMRLGPVFTVVAFDGDMPDVITEYTITSAGIFSLPFTISNNGTIFLTQSMDYDAPGVPNEYVFNVSATSSKNQITLVPARVHVVVMDVNDEVPSFPEPKYKFTILENNTINSTLFTLRAFDNDKDPAYHTLSYTILTSQVPFQILDPASGKVSSMKILDFEELLDQPLSFVIQASDGVYVATATVTVILKDVNEFVPKFNKSIYHFEIGLNVTFGESVGRVAAGDRDGTGYVVNYSIHLSDHVSLPFQIDHTGLITAHFTEDTPLGPSFQFSVMAEDQDGYRSDPVSVEVRFSGLDQAVVPLDHCLEVRENEHSNTPLLRLADHYIGPEILEYTYTLKTMKTPFDLSGKRSRLTLNEPLDYELHSHYKLEVSARNKFGLHQNVSVAVCVLNINDNPPRFAKSAAMTTISRNAGPMTILEVSMDDDDVIASDGRVDSPLSHWCCTAPNKLLTGNNITFTVKSSQEEELFEAVYNSKTRSMVLRSLVPARDINECRYELVITAADEDGRQSPIPLAVTVHVQRTLKFPPVFTGNDSYHLVLQENKVMNIVKVRAQPDVILETCIAPSQYVMKYVVESDSNVPFDVDENGNIFNTRELDYEEDIRQYTFEVVATNTGGLSSSLPVTVVLKDVNEFCPLFESNHLTVYLPESTPPGAKVTDVMATDEDGSPTHSAVLYKLIIGENPLLIDVSSSGHVSLAEKLEYVPGGEDTFQFQIQAYNNMGVETENLSCDNSSILTLSIVVMDVNDKPPSFDQLLYIFHVRENESATVDLPVELGQLKFSDLDTTGEPMVFELIPPTLSFLRIDSIGRIHLVGPLDFEVQQNHTVQVVISDGTNTALTPAVIQLFVLNINEHHPKLDGPYQAILSENVISDESIAAFKAVDRDLGLFGRITYSLEGPHAKYFKITKRGAVFNKKLFDYESDPHSYAVVVKATDGGGKMATHLLMVNLTDVNDERPSFEQEIYQANVTEMATSEKKTVLKVKAFDLDISEEFRLLKYSLIGDDSQNFVINSTTGDISTAVHLDYETGPHLYQFSAVAMDTGGLSSTAAVIVNVLDSNDNNPIITQEDGVTIATDFNIAIPEDLEEGSIVTTFKAFDRDGTERYNKIANFSISSGHESPPFSLGSNGVLALTGKVERYQNFSLVIVAIDNGGRRSPSVRVMVTVDPVNKMPPVFTELKYNYTVKEGEVPTGPIATLQAMDPDQDQIYFNLVSGPEKFVTVDQFGHIYMSRPFDFETGFQFHFQFEVSDSNFTSLEHARLTVHVLPVNEFGPVITSDSRLYQVPETTPPGNFSFLLRASDEDRDHGDSGHGNIVSMVIMSPTPYFLIHYYGDGAATVSNARTFDYEAGPLAFELRFQATDGGGLSSSEPLMVRIEITDENDNKPVFEDSKYTFTVMENKAGFVGHVTATDSDSSEEFNSVMYKIHKGNSPNSNCPIDFRIESTGDIFLDTPLDYECVPDIIKLMIKACDKNIQKCSSTEVHIITEDVNEFSPVFTSSRYSFSVNELAQVGSSVSSVEASDKDGSTDYGTVVRYKGVGVPDVFEVTPGGEVKVVRELDFETQPSSYQFHVLALDGEGRQGSAVVMVTVTNSNEFPPEFDPLLYVVSVPENSFPIVVEGKAANVLTTLSVTDGDLQSEELLFRIVSKDPLPFAVLSNGDVLLRRSLDYETDQMYEFSVFAEEGNLTSQNPATVRVLVDNINDNRPYFTQSVFEYQLEENARPLGPVLTLSAQDQDGLLNRLVYRVSSDSPDNVEVREDGGVVITQPFDYEVLTLPYLEFSVSASDGVHSSVNETTVIIKVSPVNDIAPIFSSLSYNVEMEENIPRNEYRLHISVEDGDRWPEGVTGTVLTYQLEGSPLFAVRRGDTGLEAVVYNTRTLDYETDDHTHILSLSADDGSHRTSQPVKIIISLKDVNDHAPKFRNKTYNFVVAENSHFVGRIEADDGDGSVDLSTVAYSFGPVASSVFNVSSNGTITAVKNLDFEKGKRLYQFRATAVDKAGLKGVAIVTISLVDVNDNPPFFSQKEHRASVTEGLSVNSVILQVQAEDLDSSPEYKNISYSVRSLREVPFVVNSDGEVSLVQELDFESSPRSYSFEIVATDVGGLEDSLSVEVSVANIPDEAPCALKDVYTTAIRENTLPEEAIIEITVPYNDGNGTLVFSVVDPKELSPNVYVSSDGLVSLMASFDYEEVNEVTFHIAISNGFLECEEHVRVKIVVLDQNEYNPVLDRKSYAVTVEENTSPESILTFSATDRDGGNFGTIVSYQLSRSLPFHVDRNGSLYPSRAFDAESDPNAFSFKVFAVDAGGVESEKADVTVVIGDVNEHVPEFTKSKHVLTLPENTPTETTVLLLKANDKDRDTDRHHLHYSVVGDKVFFDVHSQSGEVQLIRPMDFESRERVTTVTVQVQDQGGLSSQTHITIHIRDVNEHAPNISVAAGDTPPRFKTTPPQNVTVSENTRPGTIIDDISLLVHDADEGMLFGNISSVELMGGGEEYFRIVTERKRSNSLLIKTIVRKRIDFEEGPTRVKLEYVVCDGGNLCSRTTILVLVRDVNEFPPVFSSTTYSITVPEDTLVQFPAVFTPEVTDQDGGPAGIFRCSLSDSSVFAVHSNCSIHLVRELDYCTQKSHTLQVVARDVNQNPSLSATAVVMVTVTHVNRHPVSVTLRTSDLTVTEDSSLYLFDSINIEDEDCYGELAATVVLKDLDHKMTGQEGLQTKGFEGSEGVEIEMEDQSHLSVKTSTAEYLASYLRNAIYYNNDDEPVTRERVVILNISDGEFFVVKEIVVRIVAVNDHIASFRTTPTVPVWYKPPGNVSMVTIAPHLGFKDTDTGVATYKAIATLLHQQKTSCNRLERSIDIMLGECGVQSVIALIPNPTWGIPLLDSVSTVPFYSGDHLGYYFKRRGTMSQVFERSIQLDNFAFVSWIEVQSFGIIATITRENPSDGALVYLQLQRQQLLFHVLGSTVSWKLAIPKLKWVHIAVIVKDGIVHLYVNGDQMEQQRLPLLTSTTIQQPLLVTLGRSQYTQNLDSRSGFVGALSGAALIANDTISPSQIDSVISCSEKMDIDDKFLHFFGAGNLNYTSNPFTGHLALEVRTSAKLFEMLLKSLVYRNKHSHPFPGRRFTRIYTWDGKQFLGHYGTEINVLRNHEYSIDIKLPTPSLMVDSALLSQGVFIFNNADIETDSHTTMIEGLMVDITKNPCYIHNSCSLILDHLAVDNSDLCVYFANRGKIVLTGLGEVDRYVHLLKLVKFVSTSTNGSVTVLIAVSDFNSRHGDIKTLEVETFETTHHSRKRSVETSHHVDSETENQVLVDSTELMEKWLPQGFVMLLSVVVCLSVLALVTWKLSKYPMRN